MSCPALFAKQVVGEAFRVERVSIQDHFEPREVRAYLQGFLC